MIATSLPLRGGRRRTDEAAAHARRNTTLIDRVIVVTLVLVATAAAWARLPGSARDTLWAEDAQVFSARALGQTPTPWGFLTSYDGYVHAVPQLIADVVWALTPIGAVAAMFTLVACAVAGAVAGAVYALSGTWLSTRVARILLAAVTVLTPGQPYETLGNIANVHWYLLWLAPFLFLFRPRRWWSATVAGVVAFLLLATEIQAAVFVPLLLLHIRERRRWPVIGGVVVGGAVQGLALIGGGRATGTGLPSIASVMDGYVLQVPLLAVTGSGEAASATVSFSGWSVAWVALVPFIACASAIVLRERRSTSSLAAVYFLVASLVIWSAGYGLNRSSAFDFSTADSTVLLGGVPLLRYAIVPLMLLLAVAAVFIDVHLRAAKRTSGILTSLLLVAIFVGGFTTHVTSPRELGPTWQSGLASVRAECRDRPDGVVQVRAAPLYGQWAVPLPCDRLNSVDIQQ